jgi:hypothetical protein
MANEAVCVEGPYEIHDFTCATGTAIVQHTLMKNASPRTASATAGSGDLWAGIAASEKTTTDGVTSIGCYTKGIFLLTNSSGLAISAGAIVSSSGPNVIKTATEAEIAAGKGIGKTLQDIAGNGTGEVFVGQF